METLLIMGGIGVVAWYFWDSIATPAVAVAAVAPVVIASSNSVASAPAAPVPVAPVVPAPLTSCPPGYLLWQGQCLQAGPEVAGGAVSGTRDLAAAQVANQTGNVVTRKTPTGGSLSGWRMY
jgi:hypothetical protein